MSETTNTRSERGSGALAQPRPAPVKVPLPVSLNDSEAREITQVFLQSLRQLHISEIRVSFNQDWAPPGPEKGEVRVEMIDDARLVISANYASRAPAMDAVTRGVERMTRGMLNRIMPGWAEATGPGVNPMGRIQFLVGQPKDPKLGASQVWLNVTKGFACGLTREHLVGIEAMWAQRAALLERETSAEQTRPAIQRVEEDEMTLGF